MLPAVPYVGLFFGGVLQARKKNATVQNKINQIHIFHEILPQHKNKAKINKQGRQFTYSRWWGSFKCGIYSSNSPHRVLAFH